MKTFALSYQFGPDYLERRAPFKDAHMLHLNAAVDRGAVLLAGALMQEAPQSFVIMKADHQGEVEQYAKSDPYVTGGVVKSWSVGEWFAVVGPGTAT